MDKCLIDYELIKIRFDFDRCFKYAPTEGYAAYAPYDEICRLSGEVLRDIYASCFPVLFFCFQAEDDIRGGIS